MASGVLPRSRSGSPTRVATSTPTTPSSTNPGATSSSSSSKKRGVSAAMTGLGLSFDPYDHSLLPKKLIVLGSAANFPSVVNLLGDVFNAPVYAPLSDAGVANAGPRAKPAPAPSSASGGGSSTPGGPLTPTHTAGGLLAPGSSGSILSGSSSGGSNAGGSGNTAIAMSAAATQAAQAAHLPPGVVPAPSRASAALGGAYLALWAWRRKTRPDERFESFEDEIRMLLRVAAESGRAERRAAATAAGASSSAFGAAGTGGGGSHSGTTTPLARSALGIPSPLLGHRAEDRDDTDTDTDDDDHVLVPQQLRSFSSTSALAEEAGLKSSVSLNSVGSSGTFLGGMGDMRSFPSSGSTLVTSSSGYAGLTTSYGGPPGPGLPSSPSPTPTATAGGSLSQQPPATLSVSPLPSEESDIDLGLVKVSDCDIDSFMMYAALVPEYCRLEGMLVRALV